MKHLYWLLLVGFLACSTEPSKPTPFQLLSVDQSKVDFQNTVTNSPTFNIMNYRNFYNGGGVAIGDINNDGLEDLYFNGNMVANKLYLNKGDFKFEDITEQANVAGKKAWSTGVVMVDINGDNWLDIYVCNAGYIKGSDQKNELFINNQDGTFTEESARYNLDHNGYTTHAAFFDYDLDGDLDVYILNNSFIPVNTLNFNNKRELPAEEWPVRDMVKGGGDKLMRNDGGTFVDVTLDAGIYTSLIGFGLGITVGDVNDDNYPDLYVSNDFFERDYLYINQKDGTFSEELTERMAHISNFSMGADMADINNDGAPEIFVTDMLADDDYRLKSNTLFDEYNIYQYKKKQGFHEQFMHNTLQLNNGDNSFSEIANFSGVAASDWSWGALIFDADNDGNKDIYVSNGIGKDVINQDFIDFFANDVVKEMVLSGKKEALENVLDKMPSNPIQNSFFRNLGNLKFEESNEAFGFSDKSFSNGAAYGDLDNDGDLDLVVNNLNQPAFVYENKSTRENHSISYTLEGKGANTKAIGAKIFTYVADKIFHTELIPSRGFQSSVSYKQVVGLGDLERIDSVKIIWPDRMESIYKSLAIDTIHLFKWPENGELAGENAKEESAIFNTLSNNLAPHAEDRYVDFFNEGLIYKMLAHEGPAVAYEDFDGDGLKDLFLGSATDQFSSVWMQQKNGDWKQKKQSLFERDNAFEQVTAAVADIDLDGDFDIIIGNGGNNLRAGQRRLVNQVYLNDGKANFTKGFTFPSKQAFNTAKIVVYDVNEDTYPDVFIMERSRLGVFGVSPSSALYINDQKGGFRDETEAMATDLKGLGMVTDAILADVSGDEAPELVVTQDWGSPVIFSLTKTGVSKQQSAFDDMPGWWRTAHAGDFNGDGKMDLAFGNYGENGYLVNDSIHELKLWIADFDGNSATEKIMSRRMPSGKHKPVILKKELFEQLPILKKKNMMHAEYAKKSMQEIFGADLNKATVLEATYFKSVVAINQGAGQFDIQALPNEAQMSTINSFINLDIDQDGKMDLIAAGNDHSFKPQYSRADASFGQLFKNTENGLQFIPNKVSGLKVRGVVKQIIPVGTNKVLFIKNNDKPELYEYSN